MAISLNPSQLLLNNDKHKTRNTSPTTHRKATVRSILPNKMAKRRRRSTSARANRWVNIFVLIVSALFFVASVLTRGTSLDTFSILPDFKLAHFPVSPADAALVQRASRNDQPLENTPALHGFSVPDDTQTSRRDLDRRGVEEHLTTVRQDWRGVVTSFLESATVSDFAAKGIREHYVANQNNVQETCMLVRILNGNVSFTENYTSKRHGRALSVKYMLNKIVREKGDSMPGATFLVMVTDGHKPRVATFGSARHWKNWKLMIPVPLGNERGQRDGWGTPLEGWDKYVERTVLSTHRNYSWESKTEKAVFRGSLSMQTYKLGSCNEENGPKCIRASRWTEVNRGVLYEKTKSRQDLVDIGFTSLKQKADGDPGQFEGAPQLAKPMKFQDYQKYKYVLNVGSNQGMLCQSFGPKLRVSKSRLSNILCVSRRLG